MSSVISHSSSVWTCFSCTFENLIEASDDSAGGSPYCKQCYFLQSGMKWRCSQCSFHNPKKSSHCKMCRKELTVIKPVRRRNRRNDINGVQNIELEYKTKNRKSIEQKQESIRKREPSPPPQPHILLSTSFTADSESPAHMSSHPRITPDIINSSKSTSSIVTHSHTLSSNKCFIPTTNHVQDSESNSLSDAPYPTKERHSQDALKEKREKKESKREIMTDKNDEQKEKEKEKEKPTKRKRGEEKELHSFEPDEADVRRLQQITALHGEMFKSQILQLHELGISLRMQDLNHKMLCERISKTASHATEKTC